MNILIYVMDSLRKDHLSVYGYDRETAPNVSQLATEGVVFNKAFSQAAWTRPSAGSMFTGCYPAVHGALTLQDPLSGTVPIIQEILQKIGYRTAGFSSLSQVSSYTGFSRGFDKFVDIFKQAEVAQKRFCGDKLEGIHMGVFPTSEDLNDYFLPWLRENSAAPFFALLWSIDTHVPYFQKARGKFHASDYKGTFDGSRASIRNVRTWEDYCQFVDAYDSEIYYTDGHLGHIVAELRRLGVYDDTIIVILGDHGECLNDHPFFYESFVGDYLVSHGLWRNRGSSYKIRLHLSMLPYEELINIPMIIKFPHGVFAGTRVDALIQCIDMPVSILDYLKVPKELWSARMQGKSFLPVLSGSLDKINDYVFSHTQSYSYRGCSYSVRSETMKLIVTTPAEFSWQNFTKRPLGIIKDLLVSGRRLFDLKNGEQINELRRLRDDAEQFEAVLWQWVEDNERWKQMFGDGRNKENVLDDDVVHDQLKNLGYMD